MTNFQLRPPADEPIPTAAAAPVIVQAVLVGTAVMLAGTLPRNFLFAANLDYWPAVPWAVPIIAAYLALFWWYFGGAGWPQSTSAERRRSMRANRVSARVWLPALLAGGLGIVALLVFLRVANRVVALPQQEVPDLSQVPSVTMVSLILAGAVVAGVVEETAFRGYMQGPIERRRGPVVAILVTGVMFAVAHLDFTLILLPYYVAVAAIYGAVTYLTGSILPAVVLHTTGNVYSNLNLWIHGRAEWQASSGPPALIWDSGADAPFWVSVLALVAVSALAVWAYRLLAAVVTKERSP